jgi:Nuclease-related domain
MPRSSSGSWRSTPTSPPSSWAAAGPPWTHQGTPSGFPGRLRPGPRRCRPARSSAATAAPGRSALVEYRRGRALELAGWTRSLAWRVPLIVAAGVAGQVLASQAGLPWAGLVGLAVAVLVGWRLRFRPSEQARTWQRGAQGERRTARLLRRLARVGFVVFHDLAVPGFQANVDHLVIGPTGVFVIDSKQWTGSVHQGADGLIWHNHYRLDRTLETVRWEAETIGRMLGTRAAALLCVHGAHVQGGGVDAQGVAIVPAQLLRSALGQDRVLSDVDVTVLATTAWTSLRPAA